MATTLSAQSFMHMLIEARKEGLETAANCMSKAFKSVGEDDGLSAEDKLDVMNVQDLVTQACHSAALIATGNMMAHICNIISPPETEVGTATVGVTPESEKRWQDLVASLKPQKEESTP